MTTSSAVNSRAPARAEPRMLIDGELREPRSGARFDNLSPATGKVLGGTAAASSDDMTAYGGYKASGIGRQNGIEGFEQYLETKTIGYR
jgi:acyl-CoA reductase-like NAD-dependent aldehyde dehydrogenase